jgi:hypothetical protein
MEEKLRLGTIFVICAMFSLIFKPRAERKCFIRTYFGPIDVVLSRRHIRPQAPKSRKPLVFGSSSHCARGRQSTSTPSCRSDFSKEA